MSHSKKVAIMKRYFGLVFFLAVAYSPCVRADESAVTVLQMVCHVQDVTSMCQVAVTGATPPLACATSHWRYSFS